MGSMVVAVLLMAGIGFLLAGLLAIGFGIPVKEFSFGNTLILTGAVVACTGAMLLGLWVLVRELKNLARQLAPGLSLGPRPGNLLPSTTTGAAPGLPAPEDGGFLFGGDQPAPEKTATGEPALPQPWQAEAATRDRARADSPPAPEPAEAEPAVKPRRNLLFSSSSRKERERALARTSDPSVDDLPPAAPPPEPGEAPPVTFDDAWPKSERSRTPDALPPLPQRSGRTPSTFTEASAGTAAPDIHPPAVRNEEPPPVTVLKSGVVDGMAYSLYSDGSIEAQMPEGMMRFASIDELRSHLDQRP
jgi:hypothetical protein